MTVAFERALREVDAQIAAKTRQRDQLNTEIVQLKATKIGLQRALGQQVQAEIAWTELVLASLNSQRGNFLSAAEIRDVLLAWGYNFVGIRNPLAFINTCLQRLAEQGRIVRTEGSRPMKFRWE